MKHIILFILVLSGNLFTQNFSVDNDKDFEKALSFYQSKKYDDAFLLFDKISNRKENNTKQSISAFFKAKTLHEQKKYSDSEKAAKLFLQNYPGSKYANEIKSLIIDCSVRLNDFEKAFNAALEFLDNSSSIIFTKEIKITAEKIALNYLTNSYVEKLSGKYENSSLKPFLLLTAGKLLLGEGEIANASKKFTEITTKHITSEEYVEALNLKKQSSSFNSKSEFPMVGIVLSLTDQNGREIESASEILEGIKFAFHQYNIKDLDKIGILVRDIERDKIKTTEVITEFIENNDVRCLIGPVFSDDVRNALVEIDRSNICLISPTATDDDLVTLSDNFYQANPSLTSRGKIFAQYLYFVEGKRKLAVLNSIEGYSPLLASSFTKEFENLGGKILAKETYRSKSYAFSEQLNRIASIRNSIDGIYAPISDPNDAAAILSQMVQTGMDVNIYGNQDWFLGKGFESSSTSANKLTFESDYFIDYYDPDFRALSNDFKKITGKEINRNVLYGYDAAKYVLTVMRNIDPTRKNVKYKIESGINVTGYHNNISFDQERVNKYVNIIRYKDEVFELVEKFRSGK